MTSTLNHEDDGSGTTVKGHFNYLTKQYFDSVLNNETLSSIDKAYVTIVQQLLVEFELFWQRATSVGAFSANDELEDYTTTALEMIWTPYLIADLYQRLQGSSAPSSSSSAGAPNERRGDGTSRMTGEKALKDSEVKNSDTTGDEMKVYTERVAATITGIALLTRQELLARSREWFKIFLEWMGNLQLVDEDTVALYSVYRPDQRTLRITLSRKINELRKEWNNAENKLQYMRAKRRRMQELMEDSGDALEEQGGEEEEVLRERALARLNWSTYETFHQLQMLVRELDMLNAIQPEERQMISEEYQRTLDAVRRGELTLGRHTYTILPGGGMVAGTLGDPQALDPEVVQRGGGGTTTGAAPPPGVLNSLSNQFMYRQQVKDDLMIDRNPTTMTLQEFAMKEMAEVQRQMDEAQAAQRQAQEEDERLGPEGVEERQRKKDSAWDDWKDDHPAYGVSNKGNYS